MVLDILLITIRLLPLSRFFTGAFCHSIFISKVRACAELFFSCCEMMYFKIHRPNIFEKVHFLILFFTNFGKHLLSTFFIFHSWSSFELPCICKSTVACDFSFATICYATACIVFATCADFLCNIFVCLSICEVWFSFSSCSSMIDVNNEKVLCNLSIELEQNQEVCWLLEALHQIPDVQFIWFGSRCCFWACVLDCWFRRQMVWGGKLEHVSNVLWIRSNLDNFNKLSFQLRSDQFVATSIHEPLFHKFFQTSLYRNFFNTLSCVCQMYL